MRLFSTAKSWEQTAEDTLQNAYGTVRRQGGYALKKTRRTLAHRPLASVIAALVGGIILGGLMKRK